ncbi:MAG: SpoIIE family protein phosphatase [Alphaproteobacteria bacterium]|nr:SpoIIE family protein phosphatase [Alphaproteobacteria bacterium]
MAERETVNALLSQSADNISDHLELLAVMGADFASTRDLESTLDKAVERITRYLDAEGGALFLLNESGDKLRCHACWGATEISGMVIDSDQGVVGRCVQGNMGEIVRDVSKDPSFHKGVDAETGFTTRSILCSPLSVKDQRIGAIELVNKSGGDGLFAPSDLNVLQGLSSSAALAIVNARQAEALVEQERVKRELELAAEIQRSLLPEIRPEPFPVHGINVPARTVSGDFFDFFEMEDGTICFNLGDVSGKGMNAALLMAKTASLYRCLGKTITSPGKLLGIINREICETATRGMFVTMVGGHFDPSSGIVRLANAGHEPPLFRDRDGNYTALEAELPPLGILPMAGPDEDFPETEIALEGGTLYVFTDGVTEGYIDGDETLEVSGLKEMLDANADMPAADRLNAVISRIRSTDRPLRDDLTLLAVNDAGPARQAVGVGLLRINFPAVPGELKRVREAVAGALQREGCSASFCTDVVLVIDEACQNIIRHAYKGIVEGEITLEIRRDGDDLIVLIRDFADTVDANKIKPRDLEDIRPGGLGTHLIREIMDEVEFAPPPGKSGNLLRMSKKLERRNLDEA